MIRDADWLDLPGLDHESKVEMVTTLILLREGSPLAGELLAPPPSHAASVLRRTVLRQTLAWLTAERMVAADRLIV